MSATTEPLVLCRECLAIFEAPPVACCPWCGGCHLRPVEVA